MRKNSINFLLALSVIIFFVFSIEAYAGETETVEVTQEEVEETANMENVTQTNAVNDARNGILQVNLVYIDDDNKPHVVHGGTGFLVGNTEGASHVITSNENVTVTDELRNNVGKEHKVNKSERKNMKFGIQIVVKRDVVVDAVVTTFSEQVNFAVLELSQTIYDRKPLQIEKNADKVQEMETIYTLGFPEEIQNQQDVSYYTYEDVSIMNGIISKKVTMDGTVYIQHSAAVTTGNSGGPIINQHGQVIGVNQIIMEDGYHYSVHISEITSVLDALGIPYTEVVQEEVVEVVDTKSLQEAVDIATAKDLTGYTEESIAQYNAILEQIYMMLDSEDITESDVENGLAMLTKANASLIIKSNNHIILISSGIIAVLLVLLILIIVWNARKGKRNVQEVKELKKAKKVKEVSYTDAFALPSLQQIPNNQETSVLNSAMGFNEGETTVLSDSMQTDAVSAVLRRLKNNEAVNIQKSVFYIGKDGLRADYCIKGNPSVSRCHAAIKRIDGEFYLEDLQATNGTYHNDVQLQPSQSVKLMNGDRIRLANEEFVFSM